jgi:hypothetical protein
MTISNARTNGQNQHPRPSESDGSGETFDPGQWTFDDPGYVAPAPAATQPQPAPFGALFSTVSSTAAASPAPATTKTSTPVSTVAVATTSAALPAWMSTLSTASLAADIKAADVNGGITYAGLEKLISDLDATLASSKTSLTAAEFADLKTIAKDLNTGVTTSSYLTTVMNDLVNGNAGNATWTGGATSSTALGNLGVGSSATQLSELNGKWFLGTDLPSSKVVMSGYPTFTVSYSADSNPLFAASGPSMNDVNQGYLGDCYFLSSIAEVAKQNSSLITSMFTANGNNTYGVRFYFGGVAEYVTVNTSLADGGNIFNYGSDIWASLAEKAYAQLQAGGVVTGNRVNYGDSWSTIGNGGAPEMALEEVTGASVITDFTAYRGAWATVNYNASLAQTGYSTGSSSASVLSTLVNDLAKGDDLVLSSYTNAKDSSGRITLVADHAMSIYGYDNASGMLEIRNPWGSMAGQTWDTTFEVNLSTLLGAGDTITVDNVGTKQIGSTAAVASTTTSPAGKLGSVADAGSGSLSDSAITAAVGNLVQAIASLAPASSGTGSLVVAENTSAATPTLVSPIH